MLTINVQVRRLMNRQGTGRALAAGRVPRTVDTMSDRPFGFDQEGEPSRDPKRSGGDQPTGPPGFDMSALGQMLTQLGQMLSHASASSGPVNYELAKHIAMQRLEATGEPTAAQLSAVTDAVRLAEVWLDPATTLPSG